MGGKGLTVFDNRVLRKIFESERKENGRSLENICNVNLHYLYVQPNIIRVTKLKRMKQASCAVRMGKGNTSTVLVREPKGRIHFEETGANVR